MQTEHEKGLVRTIRGEARVAQEQQLDMKSNELIRVRKFPEWRCAKKTFANFSCSERRLSKLEM